jgi:hypothetical protein
MAGVFAGFFLAGLGVSFARTANVAEEVGVNMIVAENGRVAVKGSGEGVKGSAVIAAGTGAPWRALIRLHPRITKRTIVNKAIFANRCFLYVISSSDLHEPKRLFPPGALGQRY